MARGFGKPHERPAGEIRRSQVITTYGAGAMVDLTDKSVLVSGTNQWRYGDAEARSVIQEPRLQRLLAPRLKREHDMDLDSSAPFRVPPTTTGDTEGPWQGIAVREFPEWFVCQNPDCRRLWKPSRQELPKKGALFHEECQSGKGKHRWECVPVRFVATCKKGHLEDFPWVLFVHGTAKCRLSPRLTLKEGATGDFAEIRVHCQCGASRPLTEALVEKNNVFCNGKRPWLGYDSDDKCEHRLRLLVRTATNTYFSHCESALSIPEPERKLERLVRSVWDVLGTATPDTFPVFRQIPKVQEALEGYSDEEALATLEQLQTGAPPAKEGLRTAEYQQFLAQPLDQGEIPERDEAFFARRIEVPIGAAWPPQLERIVLARKLREVRVQLGFTRSEPVSPDLEGECNLGVELARVGLNDNWLPACEIRGEGLFLNLSEDAVRQWEQRPAVLAREQELREGHASYVDGKAQELDFPGARFYLLHSLSHLLITAIALECGYGASAIRERIYCPATKDALPMAAILLSTGTPGSEGTLGGLVEQGTRIVQHLQRAYDSAELCANDPVCASHSPSQDHAERFLEGAACHGCLHIAEPSCERFNRYLDRALVVPTLGNDPELAFFRGRP